MNLLKLSAISIAIFLCTSAYSLDFNRDANRLLDGTYVGYLSIDSQGAKIPAILEVAKGPYPWLKANETSFAVLKVLFGGFQSHEYVTQFFAVYHHKNLTFDATFDGNGPDTSLLGARISSDGREIRTNISTLLGGSATGQSTFRFLEAGQSTLELLKDLYTDRYTIPSVSDEYHGFCNGAKKVIQLESRRNNSSTNHPHVPFYGYNVVGRVGRKTTYRGLREGRDDAASFVFKHGTRHVSYNYYNQKISFPGISSYCDFNEKGISCSENCSFKRNKKFHPLLIQQDYKWTIDKELTNTEGRADQRKFTTSTLKDRAGFYYGYMYFSNTSHYEKVVMEVSSNKTSTGQEYLRLEGTVYIASGPINTATYIPFRFKPTSIEGNGSKPFLLISSEDQFVKFDKWIDNNLAGTWYSKSFGKVGTFSLQRKIGHITPQCTVEIPSELAGHYLANKSNRVYNSSYRPIGAYSNSLNLSLTSDFENIAPPYFPFILSGGLQTDFLSMFAGIASHTNMTFIEKGYYDPFTSAFYIQLDNGRSLYGKAFNNTIAAYMSGEATPGKAIGWETKVKFTKERRPSVAQ